MDPYLLAEQAAHQFGSASGIPSHDVAVILGTGLARAASSIGPSSSRQDLGTLPGFPPAFVSHQRSEVWTLEVGGRHVLAFLGRLHLYEGYDVAQVAHPVRTAVAAGCRTIVITNASGSLRPEFGPGDVVLIADHLNLTGRSPLAGMATPSVAPSATPSAAGRATGSGRATPFVDLVDAWSPRLRALAKDIDPSLAEGVYAQVTGPQFETPAEIRMLRTMGADLVGMSSAVEAIAARQMGAEVLGLSLVTNLAAGMASDDISPSSIIGVGERRADEVARIIREVVAAL
ncbi:MAG: purine-nucleoside phosphorylase [Acidimicrobiales bacterium]